MLTTRDRTDELRDLEELWAAPAAAEPLLVRPPRAKRRGPRVVGPSLAAGWIALFAAGELFAPPGDPLVAAPLWAEYAVVGLLFSLLAGAFLGRGAPRFGFGAAAVAGALGVALAIECRASAHHLGAWWQVELGATAALTVVALAGLALRLRGE